MDEDTGPLATRLAPSLRAQSTEYNTSALIVSYELLLNFGQFPNAYSDRC